MFRQMNKIIVPIRSVSQRYSSMKQRYSVSQKYSVSKKCFTSISSNLKTKTLDFLQTPEYQAYASFCIAVSIFASACDNSVYNLKSLSHHEKIIYIITKGFVVGLTYPISFPLIACYVSYVSYKKNKESKDKDSELV